jgi:hypothetical protein
LPRLAWTEFFLLGCRKIDLVYLGLFMLAEGEILKAGLLLGVGVIFQVNHG